MNVNVQWKNRDECIRWFEKIKKGTGDARPLWVSLAPNILKVVNNQFDKSIAWKPISPKYREWKARHGFFTNVGMMTGMLKTSSGISSIKVMHPKYLTWAVNPSGANPYSGKQVGEYAKYFNKHRKIYRYTVEWLNQNILNDQELGGKTYKWFNAQLRPFS